jgi:hypothetical protein
VAKKAAVAEAAKAAAAAEASAAGVCDVPFTPSHHLWPLAKRQKQCRICDRLIQFSQRIWLRDGLIVWPNAAIRALDWSACPNLRRPLHFPKILT